MYIFTAPTCISTITTLEHCALNAETQHFILRFNKIFLYFVGIPLKEEGDRGVKERVTLLITLVYNLEGKKI
jgi:hypothetical protein